MSLLLSFGLDGVSVNTSLPLISSMCSVSRMRTSVFLVICFVNTKKCSPKDAVCNAKNAKKNGSILDIGPSLRCYKLSQFSADANSQVE